MDKYYKKIKLSVLWEASFVTHDVRDRNALEKERKITPKRLLQPAKTRLPSLDYQFFHLVINVTLEKST